ncbi:2-dehydro-3-deoxy-6-phosphogalactonate aldolase [Jiella sp. MQZ9-1]|uniref:2-dehydro-3-deoxy-6-phosphogalactonate aldolase n=1 Tax=Jiella flava TaxID=2816857 RepID=A0A939FVS4_9HYPH|nr:2-dehydro-3-deoxy-6-phosphogalactonate aldolase [Jiella flava]MBO0661075.1 2-dehydro-3-deoxy-6-phosphogalactonate aldolase [Jiella flava]MCD2469722.1 2-dehydro-3-deoxy-6-phosphogalactonate aldolase [Jiella flava]
MSETTPWPKLKRDLVAILRGLRPQTCEAIVAVLIEAGFEAIEIPLNSPEPFLSIERASMLAPDGVLIGAGTVLDAASVDRLADCGGELLVSPNVDAAVLRRAREQGLVTMPGVFTATEALAAASLGASALKFFPASVLGPSGITAIRAVLPAGLPIGAVGGVSEADFAAYGAAGIRHFGLGSSLYKPGDDAATVKARAERTIRAYDAVFAAG